MALIKCSECGNMVSSMAAACPSCGCPINKMTLKSRFYLEIDKDIDKDCFPIVFKIGSKEFCINSFWKGKGCIGIAEVFSNEIQISETMAADVEISYTFQDIPFASSERRIIKFGDIIFGKNYLFHCTSHVYNGEGDRFFDFSYGMDATASFAIGDEYNNLPLVDLSQEIAIDDFEIEDGVLKKYKGNDSNVNIPNTVISIGRGAFADCTSLTTVTIPDSVTKIGAHAFDNCTSLTSVTIPDSVTKIDWNAFCGCEALNAVYISDLKAWCEIELRSVDSPLYYAKNLYLNGERLTNVVIPQGITKISPCFAGCSLTHIIIPDSVTEIGNDAFWMCTSLTSIIIPNSVTKIGEDAFRGCTSLTSIIIPDSVTEIGRCTFDGCTSLTSIIIPDSVTKISGCAFARCSSLTSIEIPINVTKFCSGFSGCESLTTITVAKGNSVYHSKGNCIIETESKTLIQGCQTSLIPDDGSVTSIGEQAFVGCLLTDLVIPDGIKSIGRQAFFGCSSLSSVAIPDSVIQIDYYAFEHCDNLTIKASEWSCAKHLARNIHVPFQTI